MPPATFASKRLVVLIVGVLLGVGLLLPWWRNHGLLRDFYDYGNIMAGVGRIELGDRPYVDFLTPIQTLQFYLGVLAERVWGARYLSLTYAAAVFTIGAFALFVALLVRPLGGWLALLVAAAIVAASAAQHTIVWYNAMGVTWLAVAMWLTARYPKRGAGQAAAVGLVWAALWLGGMTKATYQLAAIAFVVVFILRLASVREVSWRKAAGLMTGSVVFATVVPVATEMLLTGASFEQWRKNVFQLALARTELLKPIATWSFYWHTPHDYHHPLYLPFVGAWGMALVIAVGVAAMLRLKTRPLAEGSEGLFFAVAFAGAVACGLAFLALHLEIAYLSGAAWLVLATGLVLAFVPRETGWSSRLARGALAVGAITLLVPAWSSAWSGARAIWGHVPLVRSELVPADDLPPRFSYLRGLRILPAWHESLQSLDKFQAAMAADGVGPERFYFVNGTDWLVRAVPEARHAGLPLWLQYGTTYTSAELPSITRTLARHDEVEIIVSHHAWNEWPQALRPILERYYHPVSAGAAFKTLQLRPEFARPLSVPLEFAIHTNSNLHSAEMLAAGGLIEMFDREEGWFVGARESAQLSFGFGLYRLSGEFVAEFLPDRRIESANVRFRVRRTDGDPPGQLLWDEQVLLTGDTPKIKRPFSISPGGGNVSLEVELPPGKTAIGGWRQLRTAHSAGVLKAPSPIHANLTPGHLDAAGVVALLGDTSARPSEIVSYGTTRMATVGSSTGMAVGVPGEIWIRFDEPKARISGAFRISHAVGAGSLKVAVVYFKSGRFDVMHDAIVPYETRSDADKLERFDVGVPEAIGWIGLIVTPVAGEAAGVQVEWSDVTLR